MLPDMKLRKTPPNPRYPMASALPAAALSNVPSTVIRRAPVLTTMRHGYPYNTVGHAANMQHDPPDRQVSTQTVRRPAMKCQISEMTAMTSKM